MKKALLFVLLLQAIYAQATIKIVVANLGQGWSNAANFLPSGVPESGDTVRIPLAFTISVKGNIYSVLPTLRIEVYGTLDFDPSGKLNLDYTSVVQLFATGRITTNGTSSEIITIGGAQKYNGQNDGTVLGPKYANGGTALSVPGVDDGGFLPGVLPVKLLFFTLGTRGNEISLRWKVIKNSDGDVYTLQKNEGNGWYDLSDFSPMETLDEQAFQYVDRAWNQRQVKYRLKMRTADGREWYSMILTAVFHESNTGLLLYPNPVKGQAAISWDPAVKAEKLLLVGAAGTILKQTLLSPGVNALALDFSFLARGIYFCVVIDNSGFSTRTQFLKE